MLKAAKYILITLENTINMNFEITNFSGEKAIGLSCVAK